MTGPRPIQNLLQVMMWGEQQKLAKQQEARAAMGQQGNMVNTFMNLAPNSTPEDRMALAQIFSKATGVAPEQLMQAVATRPQSAATTGDAAAFGRYQGIEKPTIERAAGMIGQVPEATIMDAATSAATGAITGMNAGDARTAAMAANRNAISDKEMVSALQIKNGLKLDANQVKHYESQAESLRQGLIKLADDKTADAARIAIMQGQLQLEAQKMAMIKAGDLKGAQGLNFGKPDEKIKTLIGMMTTQTSGPMSDEAKNAYAVTMNQMANSIAQDIAAAGTPEAMAAAQEFMTAFTTKNMTKMSPGKVGSFFGAKTKK